MNRFKSAVIVILFLCSLSCAQAHLAIEEMVEDAKAFLESLSPEARAQAVQEFKSDNRHNWHYVPRERQGLPLKELNKKQHDLLHALLDSALSQRGYIKATTIVALEQILYEMENKSPVRDPGAYCITFFGEPSETETWGWRFEGHHLSINLTLAKGKFVSGTPIFFGANPAEVKSGTGKEMRPLAQEEDLGRKLVNALDDEQRRSAIFSDKAPREIFTRAARTVKPLEQQGIAFGEMNREQGEIFLNLIKEYIYRYRDAIADEDWKKIRAAGLEHIHFAWAGGIEKGEGHYYRVQGPTFLLEYDNTQNDANHVHTVWRDFENDFGADILKQHYERDSHKK
ncbi:MAG: DUF3500 domain-containing protein [Verrucomicrobia bacterium]|nr:DUF3500 domain-containing protein [Verrucomicrobiota bacterium]